MSDGTMDHAMKQQGSGIYAIENVLSGKRYVGSATDLYQRRIQHFSLLRRNIHHNRHLQSAWNKYKEGAFRFVVLEYVLPAFLLDIEQKYIDKNRNGYNILKQADKPPS